MDPRESYVWNMSELTLVPQYIRSYLTLRCLKKPIPILNQPWQCCIIILPYFVTKKGGKEIKKFALLSSFLVSWSLTSVYIGENLFRIMDTLGWNHFCENILMLMPHRFTKYLYNFSPNYIQNSIFFCQTTEEDDKNALSRLVSTHWNKEKLWPGIKSFFSSLLLLFSTNQTKEDCHTGQKGIRIGFYFENNMS